MHNKNMKDAREKLKKNLFLVLIISSIIILPFYLQNKMSLFNDVIRGGREEVSREEIPAEENYQSREDYTPTREDVSREEIPAEEDYQSREDYTTSKEDVYREEIPTEEDSSYPIDPYSARKNFNNSREEEIRSSREENLPTLKESTSSREEMLSTRETVAERLSSQKAEEDFSKITTERLRDRNELNIYNEDNDKTIIGRETEIRVISNLREAEKVTRETLRESNDFSRQLIITPSTDSDGDGISDLQERQYHTDFTNPDSDGDGISDGEEILAYNSDPLKTVPRDFTASINNLSDKITRSRPLIKGSAKPHEKIIITATQDHKNKIKICETESDDQGIFVCQPGEDLKKGNYYLSANSKKEIKINVLNNENEEKIEIEVKKAPKTLEILTKTENISKALHNILEANLVELYFRPALERILSSELRIQKLIGQSEPDATVVVTWQSVTFNSTVLADVHQGQFEIPIPDKLKPGQHNILVYVYNTKLNLISNVKKISFFKE